MPRRRPALSFTTLTISLFFSSISAIGCTLPSPLAPELEGSVGMTHRGMLVHGVEIPAKGDGYEFLRDNGRHWAQDRFAAAIERAAAKVEAERPGGTLVIGDVSAKNGGTLLPHLSHRSGRDADLVLYAQTLEGAPVASPGFIHYGADGLAWDDEHQRFLRFDVEREWLLVKALLEDPEARIQWMFANHVIEARLVEWARARGESDEIVWRAEQVMLEPHPGGPHDDHLHVRTACAANEIATGCVPWGPERPWLVTGGARPIVDEGDAAKALVSPSDAP